MFGFKKKQSVPEQEQVQKQVQGDEAGLPEGCELLVECEFVDISGGGGPTFRPIAL